MVYGEKKREAEKYSTFRNFRLGKDKVKEKIEYDHVGIKKTFFLVTSRPGQKIG